MYFRLKSSVKCNIDIYMLPRILIPFVIYVCQRINFFVYKPIHKIPHPTPKPICCLVILNLLTCQHLQQCHLPVQVLVKKRTFYLSSASYQTALCLGLVNLVFMCTQWPVLVYSLGCGSAFPGLDQVLGGFYLAAFYACEPYGLILTLTRIRALFFGAAANAGGSPGGGASNMHVLERLGRFGFRALCLLLFPAMVGFAQFQLLSSPRCVFFYDKFSWELSAQCDRLPIMSAASRLMFALQAFNLLAYLFMAVWLKRKVRKGIAN